MDDITLDLPVNEELQIAQDWLNANVRNPFYLILNPPTCILQKTDTMTYAGSSAWNAIEWNNLVADTEDPSTPMFDSGDNTKVTITTPGWYQCTVNVSMNIDVANNTFTAAFRINGNSSEIYCGDSCEWNTSSVTHACSFSTLLALDTSDYVEALVKMTRGTSLTSVTTWGTPRLAVRRIRGIG